MNRTTAIAVGASGFALMIVSARLITNYVLNRTTRRVPPWISALFLFGRGGLFVSFVWAAVILNGVACLCVIALWGATFLVRQRMNPSQVARSMGYSPGVLALARKQARTDLAGDATVNEELVEARTDFIMRAWGYTTTSDGEWRVRCTNAAYPAVSPDAFRESNRRRVGYPPGHLLVRGVGVGGRERG